MLYGILIALQLVISVLMVVAILMQSSKGGGLAGIAGGALASSVFGGRATATFLSKATTVLAALFMLNCLSMAVISAHRESTTSVTQQAVSQEQPVSPVPSLPATGGMETDPAPAMPEQEQP
ncbi:preprotein translocase subunit SecG [bacterium]|nr:preprotein translocase subunit SecG [bacterium]MBU1984348.1 preprotein translocase subunit SecG [bacterium]